MATQTKFCIIFSRAVLVLFRLLIWLLAEHSSCHQQRCRRLGYCCAVIDLSPITIEGNEINPIVTLNIIVIIAMIGIYNHCLLMINALVTFHIIVIIIVIIAGFVRVLKNLESHGILFLSFPGLESHGILCRVMESHGKLNHY